MEGVAKKTQSAIRRLGEREICVCPLWEERDPKQAESQAREVEEMQTLARYRGPPQKTQTSF